MSNIIYGLIDPNTNELRYIGKTNNQKVRLNRHHQLSHLKSNSHHDNWIKSLLSSGQRAEMIIIETYNTYELLNQAEIDTIAYFKFIGCDLTNGTPGGDGRSNFKHSKETREKISKGNIGKICSDSTKLAISMANKGNTVNIGRVLSDETKAKIGKSNKIAHQNDTGRPHSEETKKKLSEIKKLESKITQEIADSIKKDRLTLLIRELVIKYGISRNSVIRIIHNKHWTK